MANTFSQLNIHCIFAVNGRENIITSDFRNDLFRYMWGILKNDGSYPLSVGGWKDHVHVFFELSTTMALSNQIRMLKATASKWINENHFGKARFSWQEGYAAFSHSRDQRDAVIGYIMNQEHHHKQLTFREEYIGFLKECEMAYDERYIFEFYN